MFPDLMILLCSEAQVGTWSGELEPLESCPVQHLTSAAALGCRHTHTHTAPELPWPLLITSSGFSHTSLPLLWPEMVMAHRECQVHSLTCHLFIWSQKSLPPPPFECRSLEAVGKELSIPPVVLNLWKQAIWCGCPFPSVPLLRGSSHVKGWERLLPLFLETMWSLF